jgi:hypothetical protein
VFIKNVIVGIKALVWIQELLWKFLYVELFEDGSYETWHYDRPLLSEDERSGCRSWEESEEDPLVDIASYAPSISI